tara:strand:- start:953 stop:1435 length:483 start_codon:yes stop_codon:yes gene_type:complete
MIKKNLRNIYIIIVLTFLSLEIYADESNSMIGYWLTSQSIVLTKKCEIEFCATIEYIFIGDEKDQKSITDTKNKDRSLRERSIVGINLVSGFKYIEDVKELSGGRIYDPGRGRTFKSNIYLLENGNLKVEGCLLNICGHEEWKPLNVTMNDDGTMNFELR